MDTQMEPGRVSLSAEHIVKLLQIRQVGKATIARLIDLLPVSCSVTEDLLTDLLLVEAATLGMSGLTKTEIISGFEKGEMLLAENQKMNIKMISCFEPDFPLLLRGIGSPPLVLNILGNSHVLSISAIAVIGTRRPSAYGRYVAEQFARQLAIQDMIVVTGMEPGCNITAGKACTSAGGKLIAVLPAGLDTLSARDSRGLADKILENDGCILSEYMLRSKDLSSLQSNRLRLIAALARSVFIVETDIDSETMKLADIAQSYKKELFAFDHPADKLNDRSRGNQLLISHGDAVGVRSISDLL